MVGFAVGLTRLELWGYINPDPLTTSHEAVHKVLFALALNSLLIPNTTQDDTGAGVVRGTVHTIVMFKVLALVVKCALGLMAVLTLALLYAQSTQRSQLRMDPGSLNSIMMMLEPNAPDSAVRNMEVNFEGPKLAKIVDGRFRIGATAVVDERDYDKIESKQRSSTTLSEPLSKNSMLGGEFVCPWEMTLAVDTIFVAVLIVATGTLIGVNLASDHTHVLSLPSSNPVINQFVTNYIPVIFRTCQPTF
ncbi:hypothetical protein MMC21_007715 [Puttea exsequens]|nr:hypothetical protein [Puttea exsequens]